MLFSTPLLEFETYMHENVSFEISLKFLNSSDHSSNSFISIFKSFVENQVANELTPMIFLLAGKAFWWSEVAIQDLRTVER